MPSAVTLASITPALPSMTSEAHEALWQEMTGAISEALLFLGSDGTALAANQRFKDWFGISLDGPENAKALKSIQTSMARRLADSTNFSGLWSKLATGAETTVWEIARPMRRILEGQARIIPGNTGTLFLWRDVTEKRDLQEALHRAQRMEALGRLSGGIAHDINNLLTAINGNLTLAAQNLESGNVEEAATLVNTAAKATIGGRDIVKQLLGHARKTVEQVQSFDLRDLLNDVRGLLKHSISPLVLVESTLPKNLWTAMADRNGIQQVIINLCVNAVHAMKGRPNNRLSLTAANFPRSETRPAGKGRAGVDYVRLQITDNGCGMPAEVLQHIFEPFFTTKVQGEGTGLGLSISKEIVEKFGGWMECDSKPGAGTTFSVFLPRGEKIAAESSAVPAVASAADRARSSKERILVVDDDALVRNVSARLLSGVGYKVFTAKDGVEALEWLRTPGNTADLVLLDVSMPRLSGHDTMQEIRQLHPRLPVVMCSGSLSLCDPNAIEHEDADSPPEAHISKPYDVGELTRTVRSVLDHHQVGGDVCAA